MSDIKIFVSHRIDLDSELVTNPLLVPVRCGAMFDSRENVVIQGDNTGENISARRMTFNELTVQYWAWKNVKADYYGLCHYRRYMIFPDLRLQADPYGNVLFDNLNYESCVKCGLLDSEKMRRTIGSCDLIISDPYDVTYRGFRNLYEHYIEVPMQHRTDMDIALNTVQDLYPEYFDATESYFNGTLFYPCNLFIMRKKIFYEYCQWLFDILFELEKRISIKLYNEQEQRVYGLLGERLLGAFFTYYINAHPDCKYLTVQRALFWNTEKNGECIQRSTAEFLKQALKNRITPYSGLYLLLKRFYHIFK